MEMYSQIIKQFNPIQSLFVAGGNTYNSLPKGRFKSCNFLILDKNYNVRNAIRYQSEFDLKQHLIHSRTPIAFDSFQEFRLATTVLQDYSNYGRNSMVILGGPTVYNELFDDIDNFWVSEIELSDTLKSNIQSETSLYLGPKFEYLDDARFFRKQLMASKLIMDDKFKNVCLYKYERTVSWF
jgi:hypothetical protein